MTYAQVPVEIIHYLQWLDTVSQSVLHISDAKKTTFSIYRVYTWVSNARLLGLYCLQIVTSIIFSVLKIYASAIIHPIPIYEI